jgi:transposase-like protein
VEFGSWNLHAAPAGRPAWDGGYPPEFRRRFLDLIESGSTIVEVARDLDVSQQTIYTWRRQDRIDRGLVSGTSSTEHAALTAANMRVHSSRLRSDLGPRVGRTSQIESGRFSSSLTLTE